MNTNEENYKAYKEQKDELIKLHGENKFVLYYKGKFINVFSDRNSALIEGYKISKCTEAFFVKKLLKEEEVVHIATPFLI